MTDDAIPDDMAVLCARWPGLALLLGLPGPPWRIWVRPDGEVCCQRTYEFFVETVYIAEPVHVGANRRPIDGRPGPVLVAETFSGTLHGVIAFLTRPPHWDSKPRHPS